MQNLGSFSVQKGEVFGHVSKPLPKTILFLIYIENSQILPERKFDLAVKLPTINVTGKS